MGIGVQGVGFHRSTVLRSLGFAECSLARRWGVFFFFFFSFIFFGGFCMKDLKTVV